MSGVRGVSDDASLLRAYRICRKAGLAGIAAFLAASSAVRVGDGPPGEDLSILLLLSLSWTFAMMGLCFLLDARRAAVGMGDPATAPWWAVHAAIVLGVVGAVLLAAGVGGSVLTCWAVLSEQAFG